MNLFRNFSIKTRLVISFLISILFPVSVFGYITLAKIDTNPTTILFLCIISIIISIFTSLLVSSSIVEPLQIVLSSLQSFGIKKTISQLNDKGFDEISEITTEINRLYDEWNKEIISLGKKQLRLDKDLEKNNLRTDSVESQLLQTRSLLQVAQDLNTTFDFQTNCSALLDEAIKTLNIQWASILLIDREKNEMKVACVRGIEKSLIDDLAVENYPSIRLKPHEGLAGIVIKDRLPLIANKGFKDPRFKQFSEFTSRDQKVASLLCSPILSKDGEVLGVINLINRQIPPVFRNDDIPYAKDLCVLASLIIERNKMYNKLFTDDKTGLLAYNVWLGHLKEESIRATRYCQNCSIVVFDIDDFKNIANSTNEEFINNLSITLGKSLCNLLRDTDKGSSSQERFYCLLPNTDAAGAIFFAGRVKETLESENFTFNNKNIKLTLSVGIASYPDNTNDSNVLLKSALNALIEAHKAGGNRAIINQIQ